MPLKRLNYINLGSGSDVNDLEAQTLAVDEGADNIIHNPSPENKGGYIITLGSLYSSKIQMCFKAYSIGGIYGRCFMFGSWTQWLRLDK